MITLRAWPYTHPKRIYINSVGFGSRQSSIHYWIEPFEPDENGRDWRFTWKLQDVETARRAGEIAEAAWLFEQSELPAFVAQKSPFLAFSTISWAEWCQLAQQCSPQQALPTHRGRQQARGYPRRQ